MNNDERDAMLHQIAAGMAEQSSMLRVLVEQVGRHDRSLYGNGRPGVCTVVDQVQTRQKECQARQKSAKAALPAWVSIVITIVSIVLSVVTATYLKR